MNPEAKTLSVEDLNVTFATNTGTVHAIRGASFSVAPGEVLALVGESGSGKSVSSLAVMDLLPKATSTVEGSIRWGEEELRTASAPRIQQIRGNEIAMIFQDPLSALNPVHRVGAQIAEALEGHRKLSRAELDSEVFRLMESVGIPDPQKRARQYPHEFSGGMRQRIMIAMAMSCDPQLIIADEPTTALDVTVQAQIMLLLSERVRASGASLILITHDLGVVAGIADRVAVMYAGEIVELAPVNDLFRQPLHPYTKALLASLPANAMGEKHLHAIPGQPPLLSVEPIGCAFWPRCGYAIERCKEELPTIEAISQQHLARCFRAGEFV